MASTTLLCILDGFGLRQATHGNAIAAAQTPHWDALWQQRPHTALQAHGTPVGLPPQQMGNSEVGHLHLGAGRTLPQHLVRISQALSQAWSCPALAQALASCHAQGGTCHLMGLLSDGGVHSHHHHMHAMLRWIRQQQPSLPLAFHAWLDGRDTPPQSAATYVRDLLARIDTDDHAQLATMMGRFYAMDRDQRWERTDQALQAMQSAQGKPFKDPIDHLNHHHQQGHSEEHLLPACHAHYKGMQPQDLVLIMNFRSDRAIQITQRLSTHRLATLSDYPGCQPNLVLCPQPTVGTTLGQVVADAGRSQFRLAETEKYAHVTYFFDGGQKHDWPKGHHELIPSPPVTTYDEAPAMRAHDLSQRLVQAIESASYDLIVTNFANADMVGHTGNWEATVQAIEALDQALGPVIQAAQTHQAHLLITADHGNAETMLDGCSMRPYTAHTCSPVPLVYVGPRQATLRQPSPTYTPSLIDVAPTVLDCLGLTQPDIMTGRSLFA